MIAVLQMIVLKELLGGMRPFCLLLNPVTWFELQRPTTEGKGWVFHGLICAPLCLAAQIFQIGVAYYILSVSMSVIMLASDVKEIIFNGLVVTFLSDLDEFAWTAMSAVFHLDQERFENFQFKLNDTGIVNKTRKEAHESLLFGLEWTKTWKSWFYRGRGGKVTILENFLIFATLTFIYVRQVAMYVQATDTGILPVARDVCALYRGWDKPEEEWFSALQLKLIDFFTLINYTAMLTHNVESSDIDCDDAKYKKGPFTDLLMYIEWWPKPVLGAIITVVVLFAGPQLLYGNYKKILEFLKPKATTLRGAE